MSEKFLEFISKISNSETIVSSNILQLIIDNNFTPSEIFDNCLHLFLHLNFTGPSDAVKESIIKENQYVKKFISEELTCEGEIPFCKTKGLILLWFAKNLSQQLRHSNSSIAEVYHYCLIYLKCIYLHQSTLPDSRSMLLKTQMLECFEQAQQIKTSSPGQEISLLDEFELIVLSSHLHVVFYEYRRAEELFKHCQSMLGLSTELRGALGKRTKFQVDNVSQLYLDVRRDSSSNSEKINEVIEKYSTNNLPNDHMIDDEVLLDEPSFLDEDLTLCRQQRPTIAEQSVLLLQAEVHKLSRAKDSVTQEECAAILLAALGQNSGRQSVWAVVSEALLQRCQLGTMSSRRTERALLQLEELSNQFEYPTPSGDSRINCFFLSRYPSIWELQLKLAHILLSMGLTKSALDILLPWDQWSAIIDCFIKLGQRERAERVIRERLQQDGETAELLCCLGDVTKDLSHYERAWTISKEKSARAMRSLALHFMFSESNHERARDCFEASLRINPLQVNTWFTYGCCCLRIADYPRACSAFKQCVRLEPDNYEAWNNCASALVEMGEKKNALVLLKEASKYNYENWRVWDNICIVSAESGEFYTTIKAYHRVMDLKQQHRDPKTLAIMVRSVINNEIDNREEFLPKLKELFARIASKDGRDPRIWMIYGELLSNDPDQSADMKKRVLQCYSRAHHGMCPSGYEHDKAQTKRAIMSALQLVEKSIEYDITYTSAKLAVKSVKAVLQNYRSTRVEDHDEDILNLLTELDEADSKMAAKI